MKPLLLVAFSALAVFLFALGCGGREQTAGTDDLTRERCEELSDVKGGNIVVFDDSLSTDDRRRCMSLLVSSPSVTPGFDTESPSISPSPIVSPTDNPFGVIMADNFFAPNEFIVTAGTTVEFSILNAGRAVHNMRIAGPDGEYDTDDDVVSDPQILVRNELATLVWDVPNSTGEVIFRCDFHPVEATGTITIQ